MEFVLCTNSYAPIGQVANLPAWVVEAADLFTSSTGLNFSRVVGWQPYQVVHDSLHCLLGILPNEGGEEQIANIEFFIKEEDNSPELEDLLLAVRIMDKMAWYKDWFAANKNSIPEDADLFDYLVDYQGWLYHNHPDMWKHTYQ